MDRPRSDAESIFLAALERTDQARRAAFVAAACSSDDALRRRVEALLRAHDAAGSFLGGPPDGTDLRAGDLTDAGDGRAAGADTLTILSRCYGEMPRVLLRDPADGPETPIPGPPAAGEITPRPPSARHQFFGEIARGGMGTVLKGHDAELNRDLAFKVLLDRHRENAELVRRFVEEAQIGGQLQHPGIVPIYELGILPDRRPFFAMKLVKGRTLAEILGERDEPDEDRPRLLSIFEAVCQTVAYAHARGVIHRDLKPSNVMVGSFGEVQVMDWGLAKVLPRGGAVDDWPGPGPDPEVPLSVVLTARSDSDAQASQAGSVLGTPGYMAPEQARGELDQLDERADVFGLRAILCEILTGAPAFVGRTTAETLRRAGRGELADAFGRLEGRGSEAELIAMAKDCLSPEREDRPRRAGAVAVRITAYLAGVQERLRAAEVARAEDGARAEGAEARARAERRARRLAVGLAVAVLALAGLGGGAWSWAASQRAARRTRIAREVSLDLVEAASLRGRALAAPIEDTALWDRALSAARHAATLLARGDGDDELVDRVGEHLAALTHEHDNALARAADARRDRWILDRFQTIIADFSVHRDSSRRDGAYVATFREYGIDVDALDPAEAGRRLAARPIATELAAVVDRWAFNRRRSRPPDADGAARLVEAAKMADPDPWRNRLRDALQGGRPDALERLADTADVAHLPVESVLRLAFALRNSGEADTAVKLLRDVLRDHRDDFWLNYDLAESLVRLQPPAVDEALRHATAAAAIRPRSPLAQQCLAKAFERGSRLDEALAACREAIRLKPDDANLFYFYADMLQRNGRIDEMIDAYAQIVRLQPDEPLFRYILARALGNRGDLDAAIAEAEAGARLDGSHVGGAAVLVGHLLRKAGRYGAAIDHFRGLLRRSGVDPAEAARIRDALAELDRLTARLPSVLSGADRPKDAAEWLEFARMSCDRKLDADAVRVYVSAFRADPGLAADVRSGHLHNAARAALRAVASQDRANPRPGGPAAVALRRRGFEWLTAELSHWRDLNNSGARPPRTGPFQSLLRWKADPDLAVVRDPEALARLPDAERADWQSLWAEVDRLLNAATGPAPK